MPRFALKTFVKDQRKVDKLVIDGRCPIDEFFDILLKDKKLKNTASTIYRYIEYYAEGNNPPPKKFKALRTDKNDQIKEYEFRGGNIRIYCIKQKNGIILVLGGYRRNQPKDLNRLRNLKKQYLNSL